MVRRTVYDAQAELQHWASKKGCEEVEMYEGVHVLSFRPIKKKQRG